MKVTANAADPASVGNTGCAQAARQPAGHLPADAPVGWAARHPALGRAYNDTHNPDVQPDVYGGVRPSPSSTLRGSYKLTPPGRTALGVGQPGRQPRVPGAPGYPGAPCSPSCAPATEDGHEQANQYCGSTGAGGCSAWCSRWLPWRSMPAWRGYEQRAPALGIGAAFALGRAGAVALTNSSA